MTLPNENKLDKMADIFAKHRPNTDPPKWSCDYKCEHIKFDIDKQGWFCMRTAKPTELEMKTYAHGRQVRPKAICKIEDANE